MFSQSYIGMAVLEAAAPPRAATPSEIGIFRCQACR